MEKDQKESSVTKTTEAQIDRAYRNGYLQAWREWSSCVYKSPIGDAFMMRTESMRILKKRKAQIAKRGSRHV